MGYEVTMLHYCHSAIWFYCDEFPLLFYFFQIRNRLKYKIMKFCFTVIISNDALRDLWECFLIVGMFSDSVGLCFISN